MSENDSKNVLSRWSQRKLEVKREKEQETAADPQDEETGLDEHEALLQANREEAEAIDLDTIDKESDLSVFMKEGVPKLLKRQALSRLWKSSPVFANVDGLNDYDEDFGDESLIMKTFKSAYKAGSGYAKEVLENEEEEPATAKLDDEIVQEADTETRQQDDTAPDTSDDDVDDTVAEQEADQQSDHVSEGPLAEVEAEEPDSKSGVKKVSLRQRLALDG